MRRRPYLTLSKEAVMRIAASAYYGDRCRFCGEEFLPPHGMQDTVWGGNDGWVHQWCWDRPSTRDAIVSCVIMLAGLLAVMYLVL
jgi:hypothetical protein